MSRARISRMPYEPIARRTSHNHLASGRAVYGTEQGTRDLYRWGLARTVLIQPEPNRLFNGLADVALLVPLDLVDGLSEGILQFVRDVDVKPSHDLPLYSLIGPGYMCLCTEKVIPVRVYARNYASGSTLVQSLSSNGARRWSLGRY